MYLCRLIEQVLDGVSNPTSRRMVEDFLSKEVASGNLAKLSNGNYSLVDGSNMSSNGAAAPQANGDVIMSRSRGSSTPFKEASHPYELSDFKDYMDDQDSSSNTLKSSHNSKTDIETMKKEECYEIIVGRRPDSGDGRSKDINGKCSGKLFVMKNC